MLDESRLHGFVRDNLRKGYSHDQIKSLLEEHGYPKDLIAKIVGKHKPSAVKTSSMIITAVLLSIILILLLYLFWPSTGSFIAKANNCAPGETVIDVHGSKLKISAEDCLLQKEFISFSKSEPDEIIQLFSGKSMTCPYDAGTLTKDSLGFTYAIESCSGDLKDAVYMLRRAQILNQ